MDLVDEGVWVIRLCVWCIESEDMWVQWIDGSVEQEVLNEGE